MYEYNCTHKHTNTQTYKHTNTQTHTHKHTHTHTHANTHTRAYADTHARTSFICIIQLGTLLKNLGGVIEAYA